MSGLVQLGSAWYNAIPTRRLSGYTLIPAGTACNHAGFGLTL